MSVANLKGNNMTKDQISNLGVDIAKQCGDDRNAIIYAFFEALRTANHRDLQYKLYDTYLDYLDDCGAKQ
jgi:hypothetical protein